MPDEPRIKPIINLIGDDKNAISILTKARMALINTGLYEEAESYVKEASTGDYNHLLKVTLEYCEVV